MVPETDRIVASRVASRWLRTAVSEKDRWFPQMNVRIDMFGDDFTEHGPGLARTFANLSKFFRGVSGPLHAGWRAPVKDSAGQWIGEISVR